MGGVKVGLSWRAGIEILRCAQDDSLRQIWNYRGWAGLSGACCKAANRMNPPSGQHGDLSVEKDLSGRQLGDYRLLRRLGRGAMAVVYLAEQSSLNRQVAFKVLRGELVDDESYVRRFEREARAAAALVHAHIVQIHEVGEHDGVPFFSLEFVDGKSLEWKLGGDPLEPTEAARLLEIMARAIHHAHQRGIVHRDLKPANVLLTRDGVPKISDFGLAKRLGDDSGQTRTGTVVGTPSGNAAVDHRSRLPGLCRNATGPRFGRHPPTARLPRIVENAQGFRSSYSRGGLNRRHRPRGGACLSSTSERE